MFWKLVLVVFAWGPQTHNASGTGVAITQLNFADQGSCQTALKTITGDVQKDLGTEPHAEVVVRGTCLQVARVGAEAAQ